jgi:carboxyl-terminal processing protease
VQTPGEVGGIGIYVLMQDGLIKGVTPIDEMPAAKAGILTNDIITKLDDEEVPGPHAQTGDREVARASEHQDQPRR